MNTNKFDTRTICTVGLLAALVFVGTYIRIEIPAGPDGVMMHFGNIFGILGGLLFGGIPGGLAAGIGSAIFDLTGKYASEAWITFINKFAMGFAAGIVMHLGTKGGKLLGKAHTIFAAVCGSLTYITLYMIKNILMLHFVNGMPWVGVWPVIGVKLAVSSINGIIAVIASVILAMAIRPALKRARILQ